MKQILLLLLIVYPSFGEKESLDEFLSSLNDPALNDPALNDPELLFALEKRLGNLLNDKIEEDDYSEPELGCYALSGTLNGDCNFHTNGSTIIKTTESIGNGAKFVSNIANLTCALDCTAACCLNEECDTALYQDKKEHNCYLFQCGQPSRCVFVHHGDYWMSSSSKEVHTSHQYTPGGATQSHENELANLSTHEPDSVEVQKTTQSVVKTRKTPKPTTVPVTTEVASKPGLDDFCPSYETECADPHAECLMKVCRCRVGYHQKHNVCRKHCQDYEFECDNIGYGGDVQCVHNSLVCNLKQDCEDGSDEYNCPPEKEDKPAYPDTDVSSKLYNSPLYNLPYGNSPDNQYPYGFPISGLPNQQQAGLLPTNQIYPSQVQPNGQYYYPNLANQNAVPQASNQISAQQWPFLDRNIGVGSPILPSPNQGYQPVQQPGYLSPQTGNYIPVVQNPVKTPVLTNPNIQPVQVVPNQNINPVIQQVNPVFVKPVTKAPVTNVQQKDKGTQITQERGQDHNEMNRPIPEPAGSTNKSSPLSKDRYNSGTSFDNTDDTVDSRNEYYDDTTVTVSHQQAELSALDNNVIDLNAAKARHKEDEDDEKEGRHSAEIDDQFFQKPKTYPPATKPKTQIGTPTQSTAAGQRHTQTHSEGFPDYSWVKYDSQSPRVSGKKGSSIHNKHDDNENVGSKQVTKPHGTVDNSGSRKPASNGHIVKQSNNGRLDPSKYNDRTSEGNYDYDTDRYPGRFSNEYPTRVGNNQRPMYDRYTDKYTDNRRRPGHGSQYPYYDAGYVRGRDRNQYPVWDKFKDDYYYPDGFDAEVDRPAIKHDMINENVPDKRPNKQGPYNTDEQEDVNPSDEIVAIEAPVKMLTKGPIKDVPLTTSRPTVTKAPVAINNPDVEDTNNQPVETPNSKDTDKSPDTLPEGGTETESESNEDSSNSDNNTDSSNDAEKHFRILNAEEVEVTTYTDSSQGPIVALALGLSITMMLLIFVGCRLRTVKRRLRKGRALHSNEADYLINGMYL